MDMLRHLKLKIEIKASTNNDEILLKSIKTFRLRLKT